MGKKNNVKRLIILVVCVAFVVLTLKLARNKPSGFKNQIPDGTPLSSALVLDTDSSVYMVGDLVHLYISAVDEGGNTLCGCSLEITVISPDGEGVKFSSSSGDVLKSTSCEEDGNKTNDPDYQSYFMADREGTYKIEVIDINSHLKEKKDIEVKNDSDLKLTRYGTTRVNFSDSERYHMLISIYSSVGFKGSVTDFFPSGIDIVWRGGATVENPSDYSDGKITWNVDLGAGESVELKYDYRVPVETVSQEYRVVSLGKLVVNKGDSGDIFYRENNFWDLVKGVKL